MVSPIRDIRSVVRLGRTLENYLHMPRLYSHLLWSFVFGIAGLLKLLIRVGATMGESIYLPLSA